MADTVGAAQAAEMLRRPLEPVQERQLRRPTCFTRGRTRLRRARVVYNQSKCRLGARGLSNGRRAGIGGLLRLFCKNRDLRFQRSQKLPA